MDEFQGKIELIAGAHVHRAEFKDPIYEKYPDLNLPNIATLSISPIFMNNPGFTTLEIDSASKMQNLVVHSF